MDQDERIFELETDLLQTNPLQPRGLITPESLAELSESIKEHGVLEPIVVAKTPAGYQIIAGERRWRASKLAGLKKVPVIIKETTPQGMLEMAIVENVQRVDLNPLERAQAYKRLMDEFGLTNAEISTRVSKSPAYISNTIRLLSLPDALKDALMSGQTTEGHARALASLEDPHLIIEAYKEVLRRNLSVRGTEDMVRKMRAKHGVGPKHTAAKSTLHVINDDIFKVETDLSKLLAHEVKNIKVQYVQTNSKAQLLIKLDGSREVTEEKIKKIHQILMDNFGS